jgi:hypothetical protein
VNSATFSGLARTGLVVIVLVLAIVAGLAVGNAINGRGDTLNGYPAGWRGGAAVPISRVADTSFSLDAVEQLQAIRGDAAAPAFIDYGLRHGLVPRSKAPAAVDYVDEARQRSAANKGMAPEYVDYVDQARERSAANDPVKKAAPAPMAPGI